MFDQVIERRHSHSTKWQKFAPDVLPFWVADMDFAAPEGILEAVKARLAHPILGYTDRPASLNDAFHSWLQRHFNWSIPDTWVVWIPGVVPGLNLAAQTLSSDQELIIPTPVYHPFFDLAANAGIGEHQVPCLPDEAGVWQFDWSAMQRVLSPACRMLAISNPQNPTGRCYSHQELSQLADYVASNNLLLVSDEIHANIILDETTEHIPIAKAFPQIAKQTITLMAATKTFNIPGLSCAAAIIPDAELREQFLAARKGLLPGIGPLGFAAAQAAFEEDSSWLPQLLAQLRANYHTLQAALGERVAPLEATYLAWIRVDDVIGRLSADAAEDYFAQHGLGISPGAQFGDDRYIRFNFGCPPATLQEGLLRLRKALS